MERRTITPPTTISQFVPIWPSHDLDLRKFGHACRLPGERYRCGHIGVQRRVHGGELFLWCQFGTLTLFGLVAEAHCGRLAGTSTGRDYGKRISSDPRLATLTPPGFLPPALISWSEDTWSEVSGQVNPVTASTELVPSGEHAHTHGADVSGTSDRDHYFDHRARNHDDSAHYNNHHGSDYDHHPRHYDNDGTHHDDEGDGAKSPGQRANRRCRNLVLRQGFAQRFR